MLFDDSPPTPLDYFATLVQSDAHFPLLEAAASIAQDEYPELDLQQVLGEGQRLSERATEARSQAWRPWRAYAVLHLWHLAAEPDKEPTQ